MTQITFLKTTNKNTIKKTVEVAGKIWHEHYTQIIGSEQVKYMLEKFQSEAALSEQIEQGCHYYLVQCDNIDIGYFGFNFVNKELFLSKLYIDSDFRGQGYGKEVIKFLENAAKEQSLNKITLTVNKNNENSINAYQKLGFNITKDVVNDIGNGFVMDDFVLEKQI